MKSTYRIIWSLRAVVNLKRILTYLQEEWTEREIKYFSTRLNTLLTLIEQRPKSFPPAKRKNIRRAVITKHNTLYYKIEKNSILLIAIIDNRQDPKKTKI
jgi:plasmid stabilization system protein ParE